MAALLGAGWPSAAGPAQGQGQARRGRGTRCSAPLRGPMFTTDSLRTVAVDGQPIRVATGPAPALAQCRAVDRPAVPLLVLNGIGASLELLTPFVEALDPAIEVIRFDVPGVGGSPLPAAPYRFTGLCRLVARLLTELGYERPTCSASPGAAGSRSTSLSAALALPPAGARQHRHRRAHGAGQARGAGPDDHAAALPGPPLPQQVAGDLYGGAPGPTRRPSRPR